MSWLRKTLWILALLPLMSCGFEPMYGDAAHRTTHTPLEGNLSITGGDKREGQLFRIALEDKFNPEGIHNAHPEYHLAVTLTKTEAVAIIRSDGTIQRYDVHIDTTFTLTQDGVKAPLLTGAMHRIGSYNVISNGEFATFSADRSVTQSTINELAEDYLLRINSYFASTPLK